MCIHTLYIIVDVKIIINVLWVYPSNLIFSNTYGGLMAHHHVKPFSGGMTGCLGNPGLMLKLNIEHLMMSLVGQGCPPHVVLRLMVLYSLHLDFHESR